MTPLAFLGMGFAELLVIGFVGLLVFGGRLPEVMRSVGRAYGKLRQGMNDLAHPIRQEMRRLDAEMPRPAARTQPSHAKPTDLPPAASEPPAPHAPGTGEAATTAEPQVLTDGREHATETARPPAPQPKKPRPTPRTSHGGGVADEPPPV